MRAGEQAERSSSVHELLAIGNDLAVYGVWALLDARTRIRPGRRPGNARVGS